MTTRAEVDAPAPWADRIGRALLGFDAVATLGAFATGIPRIMDADDAHLLTEAWRTFAYIVFAGLWALLAIAPRGQRGVWELVIVHKVAVTVFALAAFTKPEAPQTAVIDGVLVVTTLAAYVLCRGWSTWRPSAPEPTNTAQPVGSA